MYRVEQPTDANYRSSFTFRAVVPAQSLSENANIFQIANGDLLLRSSALTDNITMTGGKAETFTQKLPVYIHRVRIKAGTFLMGDDAGNSNEKPVHSVTLAKDFYMGKYQVTRAQYAAFLNAVGVAGVTIDNLARHNVSGYGEQNLFTVNQWGWTPRYNTETNQWEASGDQPMIYVTWFGAKAYADWIGGSLPTEAQWEYAAVPARQQLIHLATTNHCLVDMHGILSLLQVSMAPVPWGIKSLILGACMICTAM